MFVISLTVLNAYNAPEAINFLIDERMRNIISSGGYVTDDKSFRLTTVDNVYVEWPRHRVVSIAIAPYTPPAPAAEPAPEKDADEQP